MERSKIRHLLFKISMLLFIMSFSTPLVWGAADVYLIYSGKNKADKNLFKKAFPKDLKVKAYNADLLAVADYSGIQKAVAKFDRASVIVVLNDRPMEMLKDARLKKTLIIVHSVKKGFTSESLRLYVLKEGTDLSALGEGIHKKVVATMDDLADKKAIRDVDVLLVDEKTLEIQQIVSQLLKMRFGW